MQAIDSFVLLPRETLPRDQVSRSVLFQHQTQDKAATAATTVTTGAITQVSKTTIESSIVFLFVGICCKCHSCLCLGGEWL